MKDNNNELITEVISWIKTILVAVIVAFFITRFVIINAVVPTGSMKETIMPDDRLIAFRMSYVFSDVERGDVIVFPYPDNKEKLFVKRVIGLPGEIVEIVNGDVYVNGVALEEDYVSSEIVDITKDSGPYVVPKGHYFMMGDNRRYSEDSRYWENKYLAEDEILGKVLFRYYPKITIIK